MRIIREKLLFWALTRGFVVSVIAHILLHLFNIPHGF